MNVPRRGMSVAAAAESLDVHADTIRHLIKDGVLRARQARGPRSRIIVNVEDVENFFGQPTEVEPVEVASADTSVPSIEARRNIATALADGLVTPADAVALLTLLGPPRDLND